MEAYYIVIYKKRCYIVRASDPIDAARRYMQSRRLVGFEGEVAGPYISHNMAVEVLNFYNGAEHLAKNITKSGIDKCCLN